jgi:predicted ribosomally synthesized peptide with SipW-like signal peptide
MALSRKALAVGTMGVAALALVGTGAGASFTDAVHATQSIHAGTMDLQISGPDGSTYSTDHKSVTLPAFGPAGSTFESTKQVVTITNHGNVPAYADSIQMSETHANAGNNNALFAQTNVCIMSVDPGSAADVDPAAGHGPWTEANGPLSAAVVLNPTAKENPVVIAPGQSMNVWVTYYAGQDSANCGETASDGSHTRTAWDGYLGHGYQTPASLTNEAQGGTITPTMTFSFTG